MRDPVPVPSEPAASAGPRSAEDGVLRIERLTKRFGTVHAVQDLSFTVRPGRITGFLGPNGAGKTTTLRMLLGLVEPTSGTATLSGLPYRRLPRPLDVAGASLEAASFHPGRSARDHLRCYAPLAGADHRRCDQLLELVGLGHAARRRVGGFSLGMRQRLALATTLLGDPRVLLLDEPANGLDPEGIVWLRGFLRHLAAEGRTVLVSSHVLTEVQQTVDDVVIIARGRLVHASSLHELSALTERTVTVVSPDRAGLDGLVERHGWRRVPSGPAPGDPAPDGRAVLAGVTVEAVGDAAHAAGLPLHGLTSTAVDLERVFLDLVEGAAADAPGTPPGTTPGGTAPSGTAPAPAAPTTGTPGGDR